MSEKKLDNYYYLEYSDYWPHLYFYNLNVSVDLSRKDIDRWG